MQAAELCSFICSFEPARLKLAVRASASATTAATTVSAPATGFGSRGQIPVNHMSDCLGPGSELLSPFLTFARARFDFFWNCIFSGLSAIATA